MQTALMDDKPNLLPGQELAHLDGIGASLRQVMAAHFLKECAHVVEIGGHIRPITDYLTHRPLSVTSIDPKTAPFSAETLNGHPCRVRHIARKFQDVDMGLEPGSYGLVLLGYSLKPFGQKNPLGERLFDLVDNAKVVVLEYAPALYRAVDQVSHIIGRPGLKIRTVVDLGLNDPEIAETPYARRKLYLLEPAAA